MCEASCGLPGFMWSFRVVIKYVGFLYERNDCGMNLCWKEEMSGIVEINVLGQWSAWQPVANLLFTLLKCLSINKQSMSGDCPLESISVITRVWLSDCAMVQMVSHQTVTEKAWVQSQASPCEICGGQFWVTPVAIIPPTLHTHSSVTLDNLCSWHYLKL